MSTAGKVLVVLIMLSAIICLILAGGVTQLNINGNERLKKLADELADTQQKIEQARRDISSFRDQTTLAQEKIDRDVTTLRARQTDLERTRSQVVALLDRVRHELDTVNASIDGSKTSLRHRTEEFEAEEKAMDELRRQVQSLKADNSQLMERLSSLRTKFKDTYHQNLGMLGKRQ